VLVVDTLPDATATLSVFFNLLGYESRSAHRGREAIRLARTFNPDVIVLDICLPDISGYEVVRALRANTRHPDRYIAAVTGRSKEDDLERITRAGFDQCLVRPVDLAKLRAMLSVVTERQSSQLTN
jgi:DNA-binding response OmpR family regulator